MDILEASTLDSQNRLEHEGFTLEGSQIPRSQQKLPELSSPITNDLYETYNLLIFLVHANFERKVVDAFCLPETLQISWSFLVLTLQLEL
jgi:hypothetical protein